MGTVWLAAHVTPFGFHELVNQDQYCPAAQVSGLGADRFSVSFSVTQHGSEALGLNPRLCSQWPR